MSVRKNTIRAVKDKLLNFRCKRDAFTIVSNNCWGAHIYQHLDIPYQTPFIGTFIAPDCFLQLMANFRWHMAQPLTFISASRHEHINLERVQKGLNYPIGLLGESIEIQFLHYHSEEDAREKWNRRLKRVARHDADIFFKFCDRELCSEDQIAVFDGIAAEHKVCFVSKPMPNIKTAVWIPESESHQVVDGLKLSHISPRYFDAANWLNGGSGKPRWWRPLNSI